MRSHRNSLSWFNSSCLQHNPLMNIITWNGMSWQLDSLLQNDYFHPGTLCDRDCRTTKVAPTVSPEPLEVDDDWEPASYTP